MVSQIISPGGDNHQSLWTSDYAHSFLEIMRIIVDFLQRCNTVSNSILHYIPVVKVTDELRGPFNL